MVDHSSPIAVPTGARTGAVAQLLPRGAVIGLVAAVLLLFVWRWNIPPFEGLLAFLLIAGAVALLPVVPAPAAAAIPLPVVQRTPIAGLGLSGFADALTDPCLVLDRRSVVRYANAPAARKFPNLSAGNPVTLTLRNPELVQAIDAVWRHGITRIVELHETLPTETWDKASIAPLRRDGAEATDDADPLLLLTFQSLTELKRVDAMRSDFVANASHELRTPLTSLIGFIDTLLGPAAKDTVAREKFLVIMRTQAERMAKLIEDLLSLSRIEMHQHLRPTGTVDLSSLLREVREGLQTQAKADSVEINLCLPETGGKAIGDREELYELFENLIENAIKYGGAGKTVDVALAPVDGGAPAYAISVTDHGPGVSAEHVPRLTERFYRADADASRKKKGTGLGLAIAKHIVNRHRGQLSIRSRLGEGMRVEVLLPR